MSHILPEFKTKKELFDHLRANKSRIIGLKKAELKRCDNILSLPFVKSKEGELKRVALLQKQEDTDDVVFRSIIGNTYGWMDSHEDVHIKGIFTKSINESGHKVMHLHDHVHQLVAEVGENKSVYEKNITWKEAGLDAEGSTTALIMDTEIKRKYNEIIFDKYKSGKIDQHSVGMQYVNLFLCLNDSDDKEHFAHWNTYKGSVKNIEQAEEVGYFWAVTEAKLIEISCVIRGSNELTGMYGQKEELGGLEVAQKIYDSIEDLQTKTKIANICNEFGFEPLKTLKAEPQGSTQKNFLSQLKY